MVRLVVKLTHRRGVWESLNEGWHVLKAGLGGECLS